MPTTVPNRSTARYDHEQLLATLNERQREAVTAPDGPILVIAGPGSGKTRVICARIAHLVRTGRSEPARIAALTFTRKAANEMAQRLCTMLPAGDWRAVWISTFHRLCGSLLREHGTAIGVPADFRIVDETERMNVMRQCMFDANVDTRVHKPQALLHRMSVIKNRMQVAATPDNWDGDEYAVRNARLCAAYQTVLAEANGLDFDDLLLATVRTLHEHPDARRAAGDRFPRVLVDEYQDTNLPQYVLVRQLAEGHNDVFVVGDPDQAIYGWRGAELANIMSFQRDFPAARRIDLQLAYRSSARLLEAATAMIRHNADRLDHRLLSVNLSGLAPAVHDAADPTAEASFAVSRAAARIVRDNGSVAILYRTNAQSRAFETAFKRAGIPYRITGDKSFYDRPEIRDALACLQAASDPDADDEAMRRFVDLPPHPRTGQTAAAQIDRMRAPTFWSRAALAVRTGTLPDRHTANLRLRFELATVLAAAARRLPLDDLVDTVLRETGYHQAVGASGDPDAADRLDNLAELGFDAAAFRRDAGQTDTAAPDERLQVLAEFLEHCRSMRAPRCARAADIHVTLSTLHGAKGLAFDTVVIGGFDAEHLPHRGTLASADDNRTAVEEERRLGVCAAENGATIAGEIGRRKDLMSTTFRRYAPDQSLLLPPDVRAWLPEGHLAHHISDLVDGLDLTAFYAAYAGDGRRNAPYAPRMMVKVLLYAYATGVFSSRGIARRLEEDVAFRVLAAGNFPQHRTVCEFRRRHLEDFKALFVEVVRLARELGLARFGKLSIEGTKVRANASKHKAMSYGRMQEEERRLAGEIDALVRAARDADAAEDERFGPDARGDELPSALRRREDRLAAIRAAKERLEAAQRAADDAGGRQPGQDRNPKGGRPYKRGYGEPDEKAQSNFTDPESGIMKTSNDGFQQCYNAQVAVDGEHQLVVATEVTANASDQGGLPLLLDEVAETVGEQPDTVLADAGYSNERDLVNLETRGVDGYVSLGREGKTARLRDPGQYPATNRMAEKLSKPAGRAAYAERKWLSEAPHGWIKHVLGFRRFSLRGLAKVRGEWDLVCLALNAKRLHALIAA